MIAVFFEKLSMKFPWLYKKTFSLCNLELYLSVYKTPTLYRLLGQLPWTYICSYFKIGDNIFMLDFDTLFIYLYHRK
jgi:hypothetical protein